MSHYKTYLADEAATQALGTCLAHAIAPGIIIHLHGDLGAGKTALTRALLHAAGHQGNVKSPTYTLAEPYQIEINGVPTKLMHFDLYRMLAPEEFIEAGFRDECNAETICIIEWPEKAAGLLPEPDLTIDLRVHGDGREVGLSAMTEIGRGFLARVHFAPTL